MSNSLTTKHIATTIVALGLAFATMFAFATPAKADVISDLQAQINALLAQIAALQGGSGQQAGGAVCSTFTRNHQTGDTGGEVMAVQKFLNSIDGTQLATTGAGSPGNETSYFGGITKAAVIKFQNKYASEVLTPVGLSAGTGYWGPSSRAKANSLCAGGGVIPGVPGVPITGNGLKVSLSPDSPVNVALVQGQAVGELGKFTFSNPTGSTITVTNLGFGRIGVSNDSTLTNVYLYDGAARLTDAAGVSNSAFNFNDAGGIFTLAPGQSRKVSVRADIAGSTSGQQIGVQLKSVAASSVLDSSVVLPITGGIQTVSAATLATVDYNTTTLPSSATVAPQNDYVIWQNTVTIGTRAVNMESFQLRNIGSIDNDDITNIRLYVDGVQVGATIGQLASGEASVYWDLSAAPKRLETGGRVIKVVGDIVGGSGETFQMSLRRAGDGRMVDTDLGQPVLATANGSSFSARNATSATVDSASVSVVKAANSPTSNVTLGASNVLWARYEFRAAGEDVKVESLNVNAATTLDHGLDNGKVFFDGVQVGSTKDLTDATDIEFTFGSSMILKQGKTHIVEIYADAKTTTGAAYANSDAVTITLDDGSSNGQGQSSLSSINVPTSDLAANQITISSSSIAGSKASAYGDQTMIAGTNNAKLGSFTLSTGSTEGVNVNTILIELSTDEAATITDLRLVDSSTGTQIGTTKASPSASNSFSVNFDIAASGTKTIDVVGNIKSGSNAGTWQAVLDTTSGGTGLTTGNSTTIGADVSLQTITVGSGTLTAAEGVSPVNANVIAGSSDVKVGSFKFTAQYSNFTIQELKVKVPANSATSVASVTLKSGSTTLGTQALTLSSGAAQTHATATFTGLSFSVPQNTEQTLDVYVSIPTIASGASTGRGITVLIDHNEGWKAIDSAGTASSTLSTSSDLNSAGTSGKGTMYVRKSIPTLSAGTAPSATLAEGSNQVLGRVNVTADAAGDIGWKKVSFTISKTSAISLGATTTTALWDITGGGNTQVTGTFGTTTGSLAGGNDCCDNLTSVNLTFVPTSEEQVAAGTTRNYELRGTVGGTASGSNSVDVSIANPTTSVSTDTAANIGITVASTPSFTWTDRSSISTVHSESTSDWTNDYLVKTLPLTIGTRSLSI